METGLEVIGRHAMLFDDDAALSFSNSKDALIQWNDSSLFIDRFDVRNLITNPPPSFRHMPSAHFHSHSSDHLDRHLLSQLDLDRYSDLPSSSPPSSPNRCPETETEAEQKDAGGYHFVPFTYGSSIDSSDQNNSDIGLNSSVFDPPFPVPGNLLQNLPPTEKVHQIMARTAEFVSKNGGQSEIVLRVKQGDNPTFGFLMPHHQLHPYFRYLVDHPEVLKVDTDTDPQEGKTNDGQAGGALSLLGSVYGSGDDEDVVSEVDRETQQTDSGRTPSAAELLKSSQKESGGTSGNNVVQNEETDSTFSQAVKIKVSALSKLALNSSKASGMDKDRSVLSSNNPSVERAKVPSLFPLAKLEKPFLDPPSEMKRLVDRIVEIIMKNGKDFEAVLVEQDKKVGKFPFLRPSNQYHTYYQNVLKKALESRISAKSFSSQKDDSPCQEIDKEVTYSVTENEFGALGSGCDDLLLDDDKKEKFKMVIGKSKKELLDQASKEPQRQSGFTVDTAAAAAILQAATRGVRKPNLNFFSNSSHVSGNESGLASDPTSLQSSGKQSLGLRGTGESSDTNSVDKDLQEIASRASVDQESRSLAREQKLKAERLRRAKMFAAMIKSGVPPLGSEPQRALSVGPPGSENSGSATEIGNEKIKKTEGNFDPPELEISNKVKSLKNLSDNEKEQKSLTRRHYRSRNHDDSEGEEVDEEKRDIYEDEEDNTRSRKSHRSHRSSRPHRDRSRDRHKPRSRHSPSKSKESRRRHKREGSSREVDDKHNRHKHGSSSSEEEYKCLKRRHKHDSSEDEHKRKRRHRHDSSSEDEHKRKRRHRHDNSEDEHKQKRRHKHAHKEEKPKGRSKNNETSHAKEADLEEGEIRAKSSDQSLSAIGDDASREASVDVLKPPHLENRTSLASPSETTQVPEDLRAKIRAMLLATM